MTQPRRWDGAPPAWREGHFCRLTRSGASGASASYDTLTAYVAAQEALGAAHAQPDDCISRQRVDDDGPVYISLTFSGVAHAAYELRPDSILGTLPTVLEEGYCEWARAGTALRFIFGVRDAATADQLAAAEPREGLSVACNAIALTGRRIADAHVTTIDGDALSAILRVVTGEPYPDTGSAPITPQEPAQSRTGHAALTRAQLIAALYRGGTHGCIATVGDKSPGSQRWREQAFAFDAAQLAADPEAAVSAMPYAPFANPDLNYYIRVTCQTGATGRLADDAALANALWVDIDVPEDLRHDDAQRERHLAAARERWLLPPSVIVASGNGEHLYWLLDEPAPLTTAAARDAFGATVRDWAAAHSGDLNATDLARVLRIPDTMNVKTTNRGRALPTGITHYDPHAVYSLTHIRERLAQLTPMLAQAAAGTEPPTAVVAAPRPEPRREPAPRLAPPVTPSAPRSRSWVELRDAAVSHVAADWLAKKIATLQSRMATAAPGTRHEARLRLGTLAGGMVAAGLLTEQAAEDLIYDAQPPQTGQRSERETIRDAIAHGMTLPLPDDALPPVPTADAPIVVGAIALCPQCRKPIRQGTYPYPGTDQPAIYCPACWATAKGVWQWPPLAARGAAAEHGESRDADAIRVTSFDDALSAADLRPQAERRFAFRDRDFWDSLPAPRWMLHGFLVEGGYHMIYGKPGTYKTAFTLSLVYQTIRYQAQRRGAFRIFYIATEEERTLARRVEAYERRHPDERDAIRACFLQFDPHSASLNLANAADFVELLEIMNEELERADADALLIVVDTLREAYAGDENDHEMGQMLNNRFREFTRRVRGSPAVIVVHHEGLHAKNARGANSVFGNTSVALRLSIDAEDSALLTVDPTPSGGGRMKITAAPPRPTTYAVSYDTVEVTPDEAQRAAAEGVPPLLDCVFTPVRDRRSDVNELEDGILARLAGAGTQGMTERGVAEISPGGRVPQRYTRALAQLRTRGYVELAQPERPGVAHVYRLTEKGRAYTADPLSDAGA